VAKQGAVPASKVEEETDLTYMDSSIGSGDETPQVPQIAEATSLPLDTRLDVDLEPDWEHSKVSMV
jgi:hypothetical protein